MSRSIHVAADGIVSFFIPLYKYLIFIHSSVNRYLGCFHVLAIINSAAMNMYLFELQFCPNICPGVGWLFHMVILFLVSLGTFRLFYIVPAPFTFPPAV